MCRHRDKIRILLANKKQGVAGVSQAVVYVTLGAVSPICFGSLSVLVKMVSVDLNCSTPTGVWVSLPPLFHTSHKELAELPGSILGTRGVPLRAPSGPLAILCCFSDVNFLFVDMLCALDMIVVAV